MKNQITMEQKLADWESTFNSTDDLQNYEILKGLIEGLRTKIEVLTPGAA